MKRLVVLGCVVMALVGVVLSSVQPASSAEGAPPTNTKRPVLSTLPPTNTPRSAASATQTPIPTKTKPAATPTRTPTSTRTPTLTASVTPTTIGPVNYPENINPLTGQPYPDDAAKKRRNLIVKVSNYTWIVRPQSGLSQADIVWEYEVEGGVTRFAAIFRSQ